MTKALKLNDSEKFVRLVKAIAIKNDHRMAQKVIKRLDEKYLTQVLNPDHFLSADKDLEGEFFGGTTPDGRAFGQDREELVRHTLVHGLRNSAGDFGSLSSLLEDPTFSLPVPVVLSG